MNKTETLTTAFVDCVGILGKDSWVSSDNFGAVCIVADSYRETVNRVGDHSAELLANWLDQADALVAGSVVTLADVLISDELSSLSVSDVLAVSGLSFKSENMGGGTMFDNAYPVENVRVSVSDEVCALVLSLGNDDGDEVELSAIYRGDDSDEVWARRVGDALGGFWNLTRYEG